VKNRSSYGRSSATIRDLLFRSCELRHRVLSMSKPVHKALRDALKTALCEEIETYSQTHPELLSDQRGEHHPVDLSPARQLMAGFSDKWADKRPARQCPWT
jgi:hypothetical protein